MFRTITLATAASLRVYKRSVTIAFDKHRRLQKEYNYKDNV